MTSLWTLDPVTGPAVPVFLAFLFLEFWLLFRRRGVAYPYADAVASVGMGVASIPIQIGVKVVAYVVFSALYEHRLFELNMTSVYLWGALVLADDFAFYLHHRASHEIRLFWAGHVNHHSSREFNFAVALRQSWGELLHKYIWWLWLPLVGFPPRAILTVMAASLVFQFFLHTEGVRRLGFLEHVFNTPSHHRVHHAANVRYLDRNYGGIFILWDRLFGSFSPEDAREPPVYGLTHNIDSRNLFTIAFHEYRALWADIRRAPSWSAKLGYLLRPPGWRHDGTGATARELQARAGVTRD